MLFISLHIVFSSFFLSFFFLRLRKRKLNVRRNKTVNEHARTPTNHCQRHRAQQCFHSFILTSSVAKVPGYLSLNNLEQRGSLFFFLFFFSNKTGAAGCATYRSLLCQPELRMRSCRQIYSRNFLEVNVLTVPAADL